MKKYRGKYRIEPNHANFWDYSAPAHYFITICISKRKHILGNVVNHQMILSEYGEIVKTEIIKIQEYHKRIIMDEWVIMPNHIHFIISLGDYYYDNGIPLIGDDDGNGDDDDDNDDVVKIHEFSLPPTTSSSTLSSIPPTTSSSIPTTSSSIPTTSPTIDDIKQYRKQRRKMLIPKILGKFKQQTSKQINILGNAPGRKNWQRDYYDHIIRNEKSYQNIKNYIINNPKKWKEDKFYIK